MLLFVCVSVYTLNPVPHSFVCLNRLPAPCCFWGALSTDEDTMEEEELNRVLEESRQGQDQQLAVASHAHEHTRHATKNRASSLSEEQQLKMILEMSKKGAPSWFLLLICQLRNGTPVDSSPFVAEAEEQEARRKQEQEKGQQGAPGELLLFSLLTFFVTLKGRLPAANEHAEEEEEEEEELRRVLELSRQEHSMHQGQEKEEGKGEQERVEEEEEEAEEEGLENPFAGVDFLAMGEVFLEGQSRFLGLLMEEAIGDILEEMVSFCLHF